MSASGPHPQALQLQEASFAKEKMAPLYQCESVPVSFFPSLPLAMVWLNTFGLCYNCNNIFFILNCSQTPVSRYICEKTVKVIILPYCHFYWCSQQQ